jgi:hypothetical protein
MRLEAFVNDRALCSASLQGAGTLAAHVVMSEQRDGRREPCELRLDGLQEERGQPIVLNWQPAHLGIGDEVRLRLLPDSTGDAAATQAHATSLAAGLPLQSDAQATRLVDLCNRFHAELFEWLDQALPGEPKQHAVALKLAVSHVAYAMTERLLYPAYLQRPSLIPPQLQHDL